jgi:hypothetical protein
MRSGRRHNRRGSRGAAAALLNAESMKRRRELASALFDRATLALFSTLSGLVRIASPHVGA